MIRRLTLAAALIAGVFAVANASAQVPTPPHRFFGNITIDGQPAPTGTDLRAFVGNTECAAFTTTQAGRYVIDVQAGSQKSGCGRGAGERVSFRVGGNTAQQMPEWRGGGFEQLDISFGGGGATPFSQARLNLDEIRPCIPESGQQACDAMRAGLWNGEAAAWDQRGVTDPDQRFIETVVFRVRAGDPAVIRNIARLLTPPAPYNQVTFIRFRGTAQGQTDEYVEVTNLGGGSQDMTGWTLRSPDRDRIFNFPAGFVLAGGQSCRVYTGAPQENSCGNASFNSTDVWPDDGGRVVLFFDALNLSSVDTIYRADPSNQPAPPNLQGVAQ
jgi:hypothetical protein